MRTIRFASMAITAITLVALAATGHAADPATMPMGREAMSIDSPGAMSMKTGSLATGTMGPMSTDEVDAAPELHWHTDYMQARNEADVQEKMLFVYFHEGDASESLTAFDHEVLSHPAIRQRLAHHFVLLRQSLSATTRFDSDPNIDAVVLEHDAFDEMQGSPGIAVIDLANLGAEHYHHVVSAFPFRRGEHYNERQVSVILNLPAGTLTQRTLIYAVRIHPEGPKSTNGEIHPALQASATWHSQYMADIRVQGHHRWESRFQELYPQLPAGLAPIEVAAESWPGESLVEAAIECVDSWRHSSGHWRGVVGDHPLYAYDMKLGSNGVWYATGIFGKRD